MRRRLVRHRGRGTALLVAALVVYVVSLWLSLVVTPVGSVSLGVSRGAALVVIRKPITAAEAAAFNVPGNVPALVSVGRSGGGAVWWFRGFARLAHYLRNDPEVRQTDWFQATDYSWSPYGGMSVAPPSPRVPLSTPVLPGPGVAPWLPLTVEVPLWTVLAAFAGPWVFASVIRARRRRGRGQCPACGYDLSGIAAGACPECGAPREVRPRAGGAVR